MEIINYYLLDSYKHNVSKNYLQLVIGCYYNNHIKYNLITMLMSPIHIIINTF